MQTFFPFLFPKYGNLCMNLSICRTFNTCQIGLLPIPLLVSPSLTVRMLCSVRYEKPHLDELCKLKYPDFGHG